MGTKAREIVGLDVEELLTLLQKAFADEWFAYYQYWLGAKVVKGPMKDAVIAELLQHATEELTHADLVANRIIQLGAKPLTEPKLWYEWSGCGYLPPNDEYVKVVLEQNIEGERCAISTYDALLKKVAGKDIVTYNMVMTILEQEVQHEEDLQALQEDLQLLVSRGLK
ncbi:MAG: ferritin [Deltaproteobacteria bacterium]|nr:ferritin [Deltaproteobacteria bacterium]